jgi:drug/metabolite transporter (DMT)-like permease
LAIFFGLLGAFSWAGADFLAGHVSRRIGAVRTFILAQCVGLAALTLYLVIARDPHWSVEALLTGHARSACRWALLAAVLNILGSMALYRSFAIDKMALVTPIAASYPAITVVLALASGERLQTSAALGLPLVFAGMMLAIIPLNSPPAAGAAPVGPEAGRLPRVRNDHEGVRWALAAACSFGLGFWILGFHVAAVLGGVVPIWIIRLAGAALVLGFAARRRSQPTLPLRGVRLPLVASAILDTTGFVATTLGFATGQVSVVTLLTSLFGVVIVLMSWVLLKERLHLRQWCGIALIFAGIALISM